MASLSGWRWTDELDTVDVISNVHLQGDRAAYLFFSSLLFFSSFLLFFSSSKVKERFIFAHELQLAERIHWECLKLEKRKREKGKGAPMYAPLVLHLHYCPPPTLPLPPRNIQITVCLVIQYNVRRISTKLQYTLGFRFFFPFFFSGLHQLLGYDLWVPLFSLLLRWFSRLLKVSWLIDDRLTGPYHIIDWIPGSACCRVYYPSEFNFPMCTLSACILLYS